jgi:DNA-binding MarR family transcriptional regulator
MSIENDINQSRFTSEYQKMNLNLIFTYNWAMERAKRFFEKADLTMQQYNILRILRGAAKPLSTLQIRQRMLDKMSDTSRIVDRLLKKELVQKVICKNDRRLVDVTISEKGLELLSTLDRHTHELESHLTNISEEEARTVNQLLDKLRNSG